MSLRLPAGQVTVLLGPSVGRRRVMNRLDDGSGRCAGGHEAPVTRVRGRVQAPASERLAALASVRPGALLLVDRLTDGLVALERRAVLARLRAIAAGGAAVLVDDVDPVAALAVADAALRVDRFGEVTAEELTYSAS